MDKIYFRDFIAKINELSIFEAAEYAGVEIQSYRKDQPVICPFHLDSNPSAKIFSKTNNLWCFVCHKSFRPFDLFQLRHSKKEIIEKFSALWQVTIVKNPDAFLVDGGKEYSQRYFDFPLEQDLFLAYAREKLRIEVAPK